MTELPPELPPDLPPELGRELGATRPWLRFLELASYGSALFFVVAGAVVLGLTGEALPLALYSVNAALSAAIGLFFTRHRRKVEAVLSGGREHWIAALSALLAADRAMWVGLGVLTAIGLVLTVALVAVGIAVSMMWGS